MSRPATDEALAFLPVTHLARLVETRQVKPSELTELYLARIARFDPKLQSVVSVTPELARAQAKEADDEIAAGKYRGPLHGIPFGLKDLFAVRGTRTTWGASPWKDRVIDTDATVYTKLRAAGAILVAKLSTGALAVGAQWFGGLTRNPWNTQQDAAGSSAGPGSATAAGLVRSRSVLTPAARSRSRRNETASPACGRRSDASADTAAMTLAWTQDTVGPMCRSVEDCALVFDAIYGPDGKDNTVLDVPFGWDATADVTKLRVGYLRSAFASPRPARHPGRPPRAATTTRPCKVIRGHGHRGGAVRSAGGRDRRDRLHPLGGNSRVLRRAHAQRHLREIENGPEQSPRPAEIRAGRFIPAVEYIQANRYRMRVMEQMDAAMADLDLFIGANLLLTNRTGHPILSMPNGFFEGSPTRAADDRQVVRRAGATAPGARVPVQDRPSLEASVVAVNC